MTLDLLFMALLGPAAASPQTVFTCPTGHNRIAIMLTGNELTYSFGPPGRVQISLVGSPDGGVFYHRELYARGEDQTLRFVKGAWSYVVFQSWQAGRQLDHGKIEPGYDAGGVLVMKNERMVRRIDCAKGTSDMHEWAIFKRLKQDEENLTPDDA